MNAHPRLTLVAHPLALHKLALVRRRETPPATFRRLCREIALILAAEATHDLPLADGPVETPLERATFPMLAGPEPVIVTILRAGDGLAAGFLDLMPEAPLGHVGLYRDPATHRPVEYLLKLPPDVADRPAIVVDPMLATGHSAAAALTRLREAGARDLRFACLLAAPEGLAVLAAAHPDVPVLAVAVDRELDDHAYIRPGLGDAGDRLFGTG